ncbi:MAG: isopentenyl phosphate kinase [Candidatus Ranarchaeia archaeon]
MVSEELISDINKKPIIIIKLGGSVITDKSKPLTPNLENIERLVHEIKKATAEVDINLIIVHGGGSFGHSLAKESKINQGFKESKQRIGFVKTHQAMIALNKLIVDSLCRNNLPAFSFSPGNMWMTDKGRLVDSEISLIKEAIRRGFTPVLFGDTLLDRSKGFAILSGDQIISYLSKILNPKAIIIGTDTDGLYSADPKINPNSTFIPILTQENKQEVLEGLTGSNSVDVTGGMKNKVLELLDITNYTSKINIINANIDERLYLTILGKDVKKTVIK